jgi:hypothetical protein
MFLIHLASVFVSSLALEMFLSRFLICSIFLEVLDFVLFF